MEELKVCKKCGKYRLMRAKGMCHACYVYSTQDKDKVKENNDRWREKNRHYWKIYYKHNQEKLKQYGRDYFQKHKERINERNKAKYHSNPEMKKKHKEYYWKNREKILAKAKERRKLKK